MPGRAAEARSARAPFPRRAAPAAGRSPPRAPAPRTGGSTRGSAASARRERRPGTFEDQEPEREGDRGDDRGHGEDPPEHTLLLLVPGGPAQDPPRPVQAARDP